MFATSARPFGNNSECVHDIAVVDGGARRVIGHNLVPLAPTAVESFASNMRGNQR
jgi:hypothetical protein